MSNEIINDTTVTSAATDMAARAAEDGDHEAVVAVEKLVAETPAEPVTSGIAPDAGDAEVDLSGFKVPAPQTTVVMGSAGLNARKFGRKIAEGAGGALLAYEVGRRLPDDTNPYVRIGATVVAAAVGATAVGLGIDATASWFGKDTV